MIDKKGQTVIWFTGDVEGVIREPVVGEWDQSPNYRNLTRSLEIALDNFRKYLKDHFFSDR